MDIYLSCFVIVVLQEKPKQCDGEGCVGREQVPYYRWRMGTAACNHGIAL